MKKIFVDSDIFVRDLRYPRDARTLANKKFLDKIRVKKNAVTSIFNVLEVLGIVSYNLSDTDLLALYGSFTAHYRVKVLFPADQSGGLDYDIPAIVGQIRKKQNLGDAQISYVVERFANQLKGFVSWNAAHFQGKIGVPVWRPDEV